LFPNVEINTVCWIIWLPLWSAMLWLFTLWQIPKVKISIIYIPVLVWDPLDT
jgi:hypothetical protein